MQDVDLVTVVVYRRIVFISFKNHFINYSHLFKVIQIDK